MLEKKFKTLLKKWYFWVIVILIIIILAPLFNCRQFLNPRGIPGPTQCQSLLGWVTNGNQMLLY